VARLPGGASSSAFFVFLAFAHDSCGVTLTGLGSLVTGAREPRP
jgi:hypothetical protein